jgi:FkbM family methyltransferase
METEIAIKLKNGTSIVVPRSLSCISTHVLLEQEEWFEKELGFLAVALQPGMACIDIGANYGTYSALIAQRIGGTGKLFSYEPASETRSLLEKTKHINDAQALTVIGAALSDGVRQGFLSFGESSELNSLNQGGSGELVPITSLDRDAAERQWGAIDFIKIDAEGEEARIFDGGRSFFANQSPLVMIEIKSHEVAETTVAQKFVTEGYSLFRLLGGSNILVPFHLSEKIDGYELNVFAAKPDRAEKLREAGLLVDVVPELPETEFRRIERQKKLMEEQFAHSFGLPVSRFSQLDMDYRMALAAFRDVARRFG